jgi:hypothetical protein
MISERKPIIPHLLCYQGLAVNDYDFTLDAADLPVRRDLRGAFSAFAQLGYYGFTLGQLDVVKRRSR